MRPKREQCYLCDRLRLMRFLRRVVLAGAAKRVVYECRVPCNNTVVRVPRAAPVWIIEGREDKSSDWYPCGSSAHRTKKSAMLEIKMFHDAAPWLRRRSPFRAVRYTRKEVR